MGNRAPGSSSCYWITRCEDRRRLVGCLQVREGNQIWSLCVHPDYRKRGIARYLLRSALERISSEGHASAFLVVGRANSVRAWYEHEGFEEIQTADRLLDTLVDGENPKNYLCMEKKLGRRATEEEIRALLQRVFREAPPGNKRSAPPTEENGRKRLKW